VKSVLTKVPKLKETQKPNPTFTATNEPTTLTSPGTPDPVHASAPISQVVQAASTTMHELQVSACEPMWPCPDELESVSQRIRTLTALLQVMKRTGPATKVRFVGQYLMVSAAKKAHPPEYKFFLVLTSMVSLHQVIVTPWAFSTLINTGRC